MVWVFNGPNSTFPSGVFSTKERAEDWIHRHRLEGTLTAYPLDISAYDWALKHNLFKPRRDDQKSPEFMQRFTTASQEHYHYRAEEYAERDTQQAPD
jgi:hypothetical protein